MWLVSKKRRRLLRVCGGQLVVRAVDRRVQMERLEGLGQDIPSYVKVETFFTTAIQKGDVWDVNAPLVHE